MTCVSSQNSPPKCLKFLKFIMFLYEEPVSVTNFAGKGSIFNYERIDMNHIGSYHMINDIKRSFCIKKYSKCPPLEILYAAISCALGLYFDWLGGA